MVALFVHPLLPHLCSLNSLYACFDGVGPQRFLLQLGWSLSHKIINFYNRNNLAEHSYSWKLCIWSGRRPVFWWNSSSFTRLRNSSKIKKCNRTNCCSSLWQTQGNYDSGTVLNLHFQCVLLLSWSRVTLELLTRFETSYIFLHVLTINLIYVLLVDHLRFTFFCPLFLKIFDIDSYTMK